MLKETMKNFFNSLYIYSAVFIVLGSFYIMRGIEFLLTKAHPFIHLAFSAFGLRCPL